MELSKDSNQTLSERRTLVECSDQGSIPVSVDSFELYHLKLRKFSLEDPFHALWKSIGNGVKSAGMYPVISLTGIWLNLNDGPWASEKWFVSVAEAWKEYKGIMGPNDPLLSAVYQRTQRFGVDITFAQLKEDLLQGNFSALHRRGLQVQPSRWFSWNDAIGSRLENGSDLHLQFLLLVFHGLQLGFIDPGKAGDSGMQGSISNWAFANNIFACSHV